MVLYLPEDDVDDEYLESLKDGDSVQKNSMAHFWGTRFWVVYHLSKKISIFIEDKWGEDANPEEEEAHA